jgi:hypothetical protein
METFAITTHPGRAARMMTTLDRSRGRTVNRIASVAGAAVIVGLLIAWIVAASLGLGAEGHPGVGPDRPPQLLAPVSQVR